MCRTFFKLPRVIVMRDTLARLWYWVVTLILCWVCYLAIDRTNLQNNRLAIMSIGVLVADRIVSAFFRKRQQASRLAVSRWRTREFRE